MKKYYLLLSLLVLFLSCDRTDQETPEPTDFGYLSMNISVSITEEAASSRVEAVPTDDWNVTIYNADGTVAEVFDPYINAPAEVQLPTGEYYMEAHSNNFQEAAFENPYYFGRSANFTIDKEELKTIDIDAELANSKVAINYSSNVTSTFNSYTGVVTVVSSGTSLLYVQGETREGYFVSEPLSVVVDLSYTKLDGTFITRQFTANIDAQPRTLYNVNVDAVLENGKIVININVDETFEVEEIGLGESATPGFSMIHLGGSSHDYPAKILELPDGNIMLFGYTASTDIDIPENKGNYDMWICEINPSGQLIQNVTFGTSFGDRILDAIMVDDGFVVSGGVGAANGDFTDRTSGGVIFKLDFDLNFVWKNYEAAQNHTSLIECTNGDYVTTGDMWDSNNRLDYLVSRFSSEGELLWSKQFGGSTWDNAYSVVENSYGDFIITGSSNSTDGDILSPKGGTDIWVLVVDANGNFISQQSIGGTNEDFAYAKSKIFNGTIFLADYGASTDGDFSSANNENGYLLQLTEQGQLNSLDFYGKEFGERFNALDVNSQGLLMAGVIGGIGPESGSYSEDIWIVKTDLSGNTVWERIIGGNTMDYSRDIIYLMNGGIMVALNSRTSVNSGGRFADNYGSDDIWLVRLDANGNDI